MVGKVVPGRDHERSLLFLTTTVRDPEREANRVASFFCPLGSTQDFGPHTVKMNQSKSVQLAVELWRSKVAGQSFTRSAWPLSRFPFVALLQMRESKREHLAKLREQFEKDKARVAKMKEQRKFKPF